MKLKLSLWCFLILLAMSTVRSQDIHFSQFYASPMTLNPALTGNMNYSNRVTLNYRSQWASVLGEDAYNTISAGYDQQFERNKGDYFGIGGVVYADIAGEAKLTTMFGGLSASYSKLLAGSRRTAHYLSAGMNIGFGQRSLNTGDLRWASQFNPQTGFDPGSAGGVIENDAKTFLDAGAGITYLFAFNARSNVHVGVSGFHLNEPELSFSGTNSTLNSKISVHAGAELEVLDQLFVLPSALYVTQGPSNMILGGAAARFYLEKSRESNQSIDFGLYTRFVENQIRDESNAIVTSSDIESIIMMSRLTYGNIAVGLSYDFNVSDLRAVSRSQGAFEVVLQYLIDNGASRGAKGLRF